jgi:comEA protein
MTECGRAAARVICVLIALFGLWAAQDLEAKKKPPARPVNLNTASSRELQEVPGIGPVTANKILQARKSYGAFKSVDDLQAIKGIGPKKLDKMRKYLTVGKPAQTQTTKPSTRAATSTQAPGPASTKPSATATPTTKTAPAAKPRPTASEDEEQ